jgi:predicted DNA-binding transcriptional regulator AlpA
MQRFVTFRELAAKLRPGIDEKVSRVYFYRLIKAGKFPAPVKLSANRIGWPENVLDEHLAQLQRVPYAKAR